MKEFDYRDNTGKEILESIKIAKRFNKWMFDVIHPYCGSKVFEIGSGIGNISEIFLNNHDGQIFLSDIDTDYCQILKKKFSAHKKCLGVESIDLVAPDFQTRYSSYFNEFDTVFALNVLEHIKEDQLAIFNARQLLKDGGTLIILVPSYMFLYNRVDKGLGHYKRYTVKSLETIFKLNNLKIVHSQYFNFGGIPGWFVNGKLFKNDSISVSKMKIYESLVPLFRIADRLVYHKIGLSTIVVGEK
ncbi:bifunctional 2-polyprenyl-6-hydroxyphenol methylase/3-demethylubiquinol 3-O-methyltransferase UbiG [Gramella sp. KN1008]|uniref:class I SAM-dependent methyltransferase n=1 Tax=Gramella sp. KN1008 TaxID=2529298 RepID=UPI001040B4E6|nr:class I SAM-dependent methyltransferase [Gramella sp. KN1008]TBW26476.1 class I SAM-dependent methyltransferase [Gramella sp. KN1008]